MTMGILVFDSGDGATPSGSIRFDADGPPLLSSAQCCRSGVQPDPVLLASMVPMHARGIGAGAECLRLKVGPPLGTLRELLWQLLVNQPVEERLRGLD